MHDPVVIVGAARTPMGSFQGELSSFTAPELGGQAIRSALASVSSPPAVIDDLLMGCVLPAALGQAPARQAAHHAGLSWDVPCSTVNKVCGSGMKTIAMAADQLGMGQADTIVAGGMECMSKAPYLLPAMRGGARLGHGAAVDHMFLDGLEDAYEPGRLMGTFAEDCADHFGFTRERQDEFALTSLARAQAAEKSGKFAGEICPLTRKSRHGETVISRDESVQKARPDKIPLLKPAFKEGGSVTAANASSISDGAAALVLMRESTAKARGYRVRARILAQTSYAGAPNWFTTAPIPAAEKALALAGWQAGDVDLWEINEAFAVVALAFMETLKISQDKVNIYGGACALGHPIGASGTRIVVTLLNAMEQEGKSRGLASICIGGGEGMALALERN